MSANLTERRAALEAAGYTFTDDGLRVYAFAPGGACFWGWISPQGYRAADSWERRSLWPSMALDAAEKHQQAQGAT